MNKVTLTAADEDKGIRIDLFLSQNIEDLSRNQARKSLQRGSVYVGRRRMKICSYRIKGNEKITLYFQAQKQNKKENGKQNKLIEKNKADEHKKTPKKKQLKSFVDEKLQKTQKHKQKKDSKKLETSEKKIPNRIKNNKNSNFSTFSSIKKKRKAKVISKGPSFTEKEIIFIDAYIIAINKPCGIPSQATRISDQNNAVVNLQRYLQSIGENTTVSLIHRIDQNCSGLMIFSRNKQANISLTKQFKEHSIQKNYLVIVNGNTDENCGEMRSMINTFNGNSHRPTRRKNSQPEDKNNEKGDLEVISTFEVLERFDGYMWLNVSPKTGKKHQIRIQCSQKKFPILGDTRYGGESLSSFAANFPFVNVKINKYRLLLHAYSITLKHPKTNIQFELTASIPDDMKDILNVLRNH